MEGFVIRMIKIIFEFLRWAFIHFIIKPFLRKYVEEPCISLVLRLLGLEEEEPVHAGDVDMERGG